MKRLTDRAYQRRVSVAMTLYVVAMLGVWPVAKAAPTLWLKASLTLVPVVPMLYVVGLLARKIAQSDELEQRTHLVGLGVAAALVGTLGLVGGMLAASGALALDGTALLWIFPLTMAGYGLTRWWVVTRRYGGSMACDDATGWSQPFAFLLVAGLMGAIALFAWWHDHDSFALGTFSGMAASFLVIAAWLAWRRWRHRAGER